MTVGFRIGRRTRKVDPAMIDRFRGLPVANVSDVMFRMTAGGPHLRPMHGQGGLVGPALTVKTRPGDNLMVHKAVDLAEPGDVIVIDAGDELTNSIIGDLLVAHAKNRGVAGFIMNGAIRDADGLQRGSMPIFAAGITHRGPYKVGPGEINYPIALSGMVVEPGDLMIGDGDGVLCIPYADVETIYAAAAAKRSAEDKGLAAIEAGTNDRSWVDEELTRLGCEIDD